MRQIDAIYTDLIEGDDWKWVTGKRDGLLFCTEECLTIVIGKVETLEGRGRWKCLPEVFEVECWIEFLEISGIQAIE